MNVDLMKPRWILPVLRIISDIRKLINPSCQPNRIFGDESPELRIVGTRAVMHQSSQRVALAASETIPCSVAAGSVAKGVVSFSFNQCSTCVRKRDPLTGLMHY